MTIRRNWQLAVWIASLALTLWALLRLGDGALGTPPFGSLTDTRVWLDASGLAVAVFSLLRLVALAAAFYLLATTILSLAARLTRAGDLIDLADRISVPIVRKMVSGTASLTITAGTLAGAALPVTASVLVDPRPDISQSVGEVHLVAASSRVADVTPQADAPTELLGAARSSVRTPAHPLAGSEPARMVVVSNDELVRVTGVDSRNDTTRSWIVEPGDHLWSISERTLAAEMDGEPNQDDVFNYWRSLVRANKDRLVNTDNPDLILPGQELVLPSITDG